MSQQNQPAAESNHAEEVDGVAFPAAGEPAEVFQRGVNFALESFKDPQAKLYVHCAAGVHRAPMMTLAILCAMGWELEASSGIGVWLAILGSLAIAYGAYSAGRSPAVGRGRATGTAAPPPGAPVA